MIYDIKNYRKVYYSSLSEKTVLRRVKNNLINSNHKIYKLGRSYIIHVPTSFEIIQA